MSDFKKQMDNIINKIEDEVSGYVSFERLFDLGFMDKNSKFGTLDRFFKFHGFKVNDNKDLEALDVEKLNNAVAESTCFYSWNEMYQQAGTEYALQKLKDAGFDVSE